MSIYASVIKVYKLRLVLSRGQNTGDKILKYLGDLVGYWGMCRLIETGYFKLIFFFLRLEAEQRQNAGKWGDVDNHRREAVDAGVEVMSNKLCKLG
jgi:hypothetical protein